MEKRLKDYMRQELAVLKNRIDDLEAHVNNQLQAISFIDGEALKAQMAEIRADIAKLAEKPDTMPPSVVLDSLMSLFVTPPTTQSVDDIRGKLARLSSCKRKQKDVGYDDEQQKDLSKEERRQHNKARKEYRRLDR